VIDTVDEAPVRTFWLQKYLFRATTGYIYTSVYYVLKSQKVANNKLHKEAVKTDIMQPRIYNTLKW